MIYEVVLVNTVTLDLMKGVKKMAKWIMPGTEGTKEYMTVARTALGVVGVREYAPGAYRVRVEPTEAGVAAIASKLTADAGWKQPGEGGQNRFSHTVNAPEGAKDEVLVAMVKTALFAISPRSTRALAPGRRSLSPRTRSSPR